MSKPYTAPAGSKTRAGKHAKAVENKDFIDLMPEHLLNRKQRRQRERNKK